MSKAELLEKIDQGWNDFQAYLMTLTPAQVTIPTDAAGWTALDHIIHLADWENGVLAMLNKQDRAAGMGVDAETWAGQDFDKINAILQKKSKDKSLQEAYGYVMGIHQQLVEKVQSMTDEALQRPYKYYQPQSDREAPVINWIQMNTFNHYAEHRPWIEAIVADRTPISKEMLLSRVQKGWDDLNAFLANLTDSQKTQPTDAAGWTVKDHMIHMAVWEDGVIALFDKEERPARMGVTQAVWDTHDDDQINAVIQKRYKDMPLADVEQKRQAIHAELVKRIETLSEALLHVPYREYNPVSSSKQPLADSVIGNTYMHYGDHTPWMAAIAAGGAHG